MIAAPAARSNAVQNYTRYSMGYSVIPGTVWATVLYQVQYGLQFYTRYSTGYSIIPGIVWTGQQQKTPTGTVKKASGSYCDNTLEHPRA